MPHLIVDWARLVPALLLLLLPIRLLHGAHVHFRAIERDWDDHWRQIMSLWLHYLDFVRAALGTWLLFAALRLDPGAPVSAHYLLLAIQGSIRILAVLLQTAICKEPDSANAPFAFVTGLLLTDVAPLVSVLSLTLAIALTAGMRLPIAYFPLVALAYAGLGAWLRGKEFALNLLPGAGAAFLPWLWFFLFHRTAVVSYISRHVGHSRSPLP